MEVSLIYSLGMFKGMQLNTEELSEVLQSEKTVQIIPLSPPRGGKNFQTILTNIKQNPRKGFVLLRGCSFVLYPI
jgi:hypothetical protein